MPQRWAEAPYNGCTTFRPDFDDWLAGKAVQAGAVPVTPTTATALRRDHRGQVSGVRPDRPDGHLEASGGIACDGVNSFLAKEAGLYLHPEPDHFTLGVKEVLALPRDVIDERFGLRGDGVDYLIAHSGVSVSLVDTEIRDALLGSEVPVYAYARRSWSAGALVTGGMTFYF